MVIGPPAALIEFRRMKFVLMHMPEESTIYDYIQQLAAHRTTQFIKACEGTYDVLPFVTSGITVTEIIYPDGTFPTSEVIDQWISIVLIHFEHTPRGAIGLHCHSGLGRSAVLVAIALMESGLKPVEAIELVKQKRRGSFNTAQTSGILDYRSKYRLAHIAIMPAVTVSFTSSVDIE